MAKYYEYTLKKYEKEFGVIMKVENKSERSMNKCIGILISSIKKAIKCNYLEIKNRCLVFVTDLVIDNIFYFKNIL